MSSQQILEDTVLLPDVVGAIATAKEAKRKVFPCHTNRASQIGAECVRELVYHRTRWKDRKLPDLGLQFVFDGGQVTEAYAEQMLREAGYQVLEQQRAFQINEKGENITGHLDMKIGYNGKAFPCEVKGLSGWTWSDINTIEDMFTHRYHYVRRYPAQLLIYMYGTNSEIGCFLLVSKQNWQPKVIWVKLSDHLDYVESLLQKAVIINQHVKEDTLPDFTENQELCKHCDFEHICCPPYEYEGKVVVDAELEELLDRRATLLETKKEYDHLDKELKTFIKGKEMVVGRWVITGKWVQKNVPAKEAYIQEYWLPKIYQM